MKYYRPHRGMLADSMREVAEIRSFDELVRHMRNEVLSWYPPDEMPTPENVLVSPYCRDDRIGWENTHIVTVKGNAWGFTDGPCQRQDDTHLTNTIASAKAKIAAAKKGDPEGEDVPLTLAELIVIEDGLDTLRKIIPEKTSP